MPPIALVESETDPIADSMEAMLSTEEERDTENPKVRTRPSRDKAVTEGRATVRMAWMWDGTASTLPLAWNPEGTRHDGGRHYLLKRFCLCCHTGGFFGRKCLNCVKNHCTLCGASSDRTKIIPCFYLKKEDVPFPAKFYGTIDCFLPFCIRRGERGFLTEADMRMHARSRHRLEYQSHMETLAENKTDELESLRRRLDALTAPQAQSAQPVAVAVATKPTPAERMAHARAAKNQGLSK